MRTQNLNRLALTGVLVTLLSACQAPDFDFRTSGADTTNAARSAAPRPAPDARGVISYPTYQVAVARPGDTVSTVAARVGLNAQELASYNGLQPNTPLRPDEIIALPTRIADNGETIRPAGEISITTLAGDAINRADGGQTAASTPRTTGETPVQHKVERGETAYSIARLYGVSVRALADWNGLGPDLQVREGQFLLIPVSAETQTVAATTSLPGGQSSVSAPPSASQPLPADPVSATTIPSTDLSSERSSSSRFQMPVNGKVIRDYQKRVNDGIDIAASEGTPVRAAEAGTVAAITRDTEGVPILVLKHPNNLLTVYANIKDLKVQKGDSVSRGQTLAAVKGGNPSFLHFEVREGFESVDPTPFLN